MFLLETVYKKAPPTCGGVCRRRRRVGLGGRGLGRIVVIDGARALDQRADDGGAGGDENDGEAGLRLLHCGGHQFRHGLLQLFRAHERGGAYL